VHHVKMCPCVQSMTGNAIYLIYRIYMYIYTCNILKGNGIGRRDFKRRNECFLPIKTRMSCALDIYQWNPANLTNKLQRVQNTVARIISRAKKEDHITPTLVTLHWPPVNYRCQYKILVYVFNCLHGNAPTYLKFFYSFLQTNTFVTIWELCVAGSTSRSHQDIRRETIWQKCRHRLEQLTSTFLRNAKSIKLLKTHLFRIAFQDYF
jgi:hypothetical protein